MSNDTSEEFTRNLQDNKQTLLGYIIKNYSALEGFAEDVLQIATITMWRKYDTLKHKDCFLNWARTIVKYAASNFNRSARRSITTYICGEDLLDLIDGKRQSGFDAVDSRLMCMHKVFKTLTVKEQELLDFVYVQGGTITEYAQANKLASRTCFNKISTLRKKIKKEINERILLEVH